MSNVIVIDKTGVDFPLGVYDLKDGNFYRGSEEGTIYHVCIIDNMVAYSLDGNEVVSRDSEQKFKAIKVTLTIENI